MTVGQERALRELERLRVVSDGCFVFQELTDAQSRNLSVAIAIRLGPMETQPGGLELREREEFLLHIPPGFPFDRPWLKVAHKRFVGFPHVIWGKTICLYQTKLGWNPAEGLYGFFRQLNHWLGQAAINDMDPVEGPLEPPHHHTDSSQIAFVVRADAPVKAGEQWLGLAELEKRDGRMELVGWRDSLENWPEGRGMALAVFLPNALAMEFPVKGDAFFDELLKQGYDRKRIMRYLGVAALMAPAGEPVYFVLGLPMRRAADGTPRSHVAVWSASAEAARHLRQSVGDTTDTLAVHEVNQPYADALFNYFSETPISWCQVLEDRPEIVVRRDAQSKLAWFHGKQVLVLGCGAIGSWAAEMVTRAGAKNVDLVDNGIVKPGLLARQNFIQKDVGVNKAMALTARLTALAAPGSTVRGFNCDAHSFSTEDKERFVAYDVVLDCTACQLTQMKLERDWPQFSRRTPALVSMITDAKAEMGLSVVLPRNSLGGPWDAYVRLKYRLCVSGARPDILKAFYDSAATAGLFQPEPGCSDPTFSGSMADTSIIAASALNLACHGLSKGVSSATAFVSPSTDQPGVEVPALDEMDEFVTGAYRVRIAKKVAREARAWVQQNNRLRSAAHETGGLLWGLWDDAIGVIWIFDASGPPSDSRHDPGHFLCGVEGTAAEHKQRFATSRSSSGFIGFWHTHPDMVSQQSGTDTRGMAMLVSALGENQKRALMLIFGRTGRQPTAGIYVYESLTVTENGDMVQVGETQALLEKAIV